MDNNNEEEVKTDIKRVEVKPDTEEENDEETFNTEDPNSSEDQEGEIEEGEEEEPEVPPEIKDVEGETPKEKALRLETTRLRRELAKRQKEELFTPIPKPDKEKSVLENYDAEQIKELKTILSATADELGFIKKEELYRTLSTQNRDEIWDDFLDKHPEYLPEKDPEGIFYNQLKEEFSLYKEPSTAKDFQKLLERSHESIFGTKSTPLNINKIKAQQEKMKVASHLGRTAGGKGIESNKTISPGLRTDALKGFTDEEITELFAD